MLYRNSVSWLFSVNLVVFSVSLGDGCTTKMGYQETEEMTSMSQEAAVSCCSIAGDECERPECLIGTFDQAQEKCASNGKRLCTPMELANGQCCSKGCSFDEKLNWQVDDGK